MPFYLAWLCKKGQCTKIFFLLLTHFSNLFAPYIKNLETYFAILLCFEFWPMCLLCSYLYQFTSNKIFIEKSSKYFFDAVKLSQAKSKDLLNQVKRLFRFSFNLIGSILLLCNFSAINDMVNHIQMYCLIVIPNMPICPCFIQTVNIVNL